MKILNQYLYEISLIHYKVYVNPVGLFSDRLLYLPTRFLLNYLLTL